MATPCVLALARWKNGLCRFLTNTSLRTKKKSLVTFRFVSYMNESKYMYDLIVIGGGSGGLACSKEASILGKRVAVLDYVTPSPRGTKWGLGGTCVNVGCIPKKLMHHASIIGDVFEDSKNFGWKAPEDIELQWQVLTKHVQNYVKSLNWGYRVQLKEKNVDYINAKGEFIDQNTIRILDKTGQEREITGETIVIAVGGRPKYPTEVPGAMQYGISSDDIFWLQKPPGKTMVVGGSYVALECAGFINGLGFDTTLMVRSIPLRGFDQQMSRIVVQNMEIQGTRVLHRCIPTAVEQTQNGKLNVVWRDREGRQDADLFDTVLFAIGRAPVLDSLHLRNAGIKVHPVSGKIITTNEQTSVRNIYALGDVLHERPELTPVAIKAGRLLAHRLYGNSSNNMDYDKVPTTVFTPIEYSCVGLSEEQALKQYGDDNVEIYHSQFKPLDFAVAERKEVCYIKMICSSPKPQKVLGIHYLGPDAGEVIQGFAVAMRCGLTKRELDISVGIHPTNAEELVRLHITKRSGVSPVVTQC